MKRAPFMLLALLLAACAGQAGGYREYLARKHVTQIAPENFSQCRGYGCKYVERDLQLSEADWAEIRLLFLRPIPDAQDERARIARAIGLFEHKVGALTGTAEDVEGTYHQLGALQQDCVDESVNTTIYLSLLEQEGQLLYHTVETPTARIPLLSGRVGPHQTAVIRETQTGERFAVDSWFHDNGRDAEIAPLDEWFFGWRPAKSE